MRLVYLSVSVCVYAFVYIYIIVCRVMCLCLCLLYIGGYVSVCMLVSKYLNIRVRVHACERRILKPSSEIALEI